MDTRKYTQSMFLSVQEVKDSKTKTLVVLSEGSEQTNDKNKVVFTCLVEIDGSHRPFRPNRNTLDAMQKAWGYDSCKYVGKRLSLATGVLGSKEAIIGTPI